MELNEKQLIGHDEQRAQLRQLLRERLPRCYSAARTALAKRCWDRCWRRQSSAEQRWHPAVVVSPAGQCVWTAIPIIMRSCRRAGKSAKIIRIEQIREMQTIASRYPVLSDCRVVLIDEVECMNEAAANSLLKTLEEPEGQVTFILITSARSSLLDTIISRCMPMAFGMLPLDGMKEALIGRQIPDHEAAELAALADGSPGRAIRLYENGGLMLRDDALTFLEKLSAMTMEDVWGTGKDERRTRSRKAHGVVLYLNMLLRDMLVLYEDGASQLLYHQDCRQRLAALLSGVPSGRFCHADAGPRDAAAPAGECESAAAAGRLFYSHYGLP